jgi:hypothetical protein
MSPVAIANRRRHGLGSEDRLDGSHARHSCPLRAEMVYASPIRVKKDIDDAGCSRPDGEFVVREEPVAPITYVTLTAEHLPQVHDLLHRSFWSGIDGLSLPLLRVLLD